MEPRPGFEFPGDQGRHPGPLAPLTGTYKVRPPNGAGVERSNQAELPGLVGTLGVAHFYGLR